MHWFLKFIFGMKLYMLRTFPLSIMMSFSLHTHSSGICHTDLLKACEQDQDGTQFHSDPARKLSANLYDIHHCCVCVCVCVCVQWKIPDNGQRNRPKHVEFHSKNKFEKWVHLVGFIIRNVTLELNLFSLFLIEPLEFPLTNRYFSECWISSVQEFEG